MRKKYLHNHPEFQSLIRIVGGKGRHSRYSCRKRLLDYALFVCFEQYCIETTEYREHKERSFPKSDNAFIKENQAFLMEDINSFKKYKDQYEISKSIYYK